MTLKITREKDCGNSPKNQFVEALVIAFAKPDIDFILKSVTDDIIWKVVGQATVQGKDDVVIALKSPMYDSEVTEINIDHVSTHGTAGSVNGIRKHADGRVYDFCAVFEFSNAKGTRVHEIIHYDINTA